MRIVPEPLVIAAVAALVAASPMREARAQSLRPLETESAVLLPSGHAQLTLGAAYFKDRRWPDFTAKGFLRSHELFHAPEIALRIGAGEWAEILMRYELVHADEERRDGTRASHYGGGDARIFAKVRFLGESDSFPALAGRFGVKLPNANRDDRLGTDETDFEIALFASKHLGVATFHANAGLQILGNPGLLNGDPSESGSGQDDPFIYSLAAVSDPLFVGRGDAYALRVLLELAGREGSRFGNDYNALRGGVRATRGNWTLYAGASAGVSGSAEDVGAQLGVTYALDFERLRAALD